MNADSESYGAGEHTIVKCSLDPLGIPHFTDESIEDYEESNEILWWNGVKGTANLLYPHPKAWTFAEIDEGTPLDELTTKGLTGAIGAKNTGEPSCIYNWNKVTSSWRIHAHIDWIEYGATYMSRLTTNNDVWAHFKYILHRKLVVRAFCPSSTGSTRCRCCGAARETHAHLARCSTLWEVWKPFRRLSNTIWKHNNISVTSWFT